MTPGPSLPRFEYFRREIGLDEARLEILRPWASMLAERGRKAGKYLDALFRKASPRAYLDFALEYWGGASKRFWVGWYSTLWHRPWDDAFLRELWQQGADAARCGIGVQFTMLGEIKSRQYFVRGVRRHVPQEQVPAVASAVVDLLDLCMLVRVRGHTAHHDSVAQPVLQGLFHQTRNPLTVIGAAASRILRAADDTGMREKAQVILDEALRLERMTRDISTLNAVELSEPGFSAVALEPLLRSLTDELQARPGWPQGLEPRWALDPLRPEVHSDPALLATLLREVLANALEAMDPARPELTIASAPDPSVPSHLDLTVQGSGGLPPEEDPSSLFLPFHSTKPMGTGFGLPIARAAARKLFGHVSLARTPGGATCTVKLPLKGRIDDLGLVVPAKE
ncbi:Sensor protein ZraS [Fundidesulfovibrio magnetotacticus]|uniref:histidine kinase n=1 Tax=Fundidesulfovibrio magnetotacticus TaxID=2730080 RepID=A0A6V8LKX4_9BACT|nr:HAMP domain-containing sensor histidine kinase [Fundidesulfovibrio magnetotacticus]GFK93343.1 Sensor protein ZraS [Fundidesulfovibrio magnetotacticus]